MEQTTKKSLSYYMRKLHRDAGYFIVGLVFIYALSGITLVYRDTNFMKFDVKKEAKLAPDLTEADLGRALFIRDFKIVKTENDIITFENGTYNKSTGVAEYTTKELPGFLQKLTALHTTMSSRLNHYSPLIFGSFLMFLAISSFWMFKAGSKNFKRGLFFALGGLIVAIVFVLI